MASFFVFFCSILLLFSTTLGDHNNMFPLGLPEKKTHLHFYFHDVVTGSNPSAITIAEAKTTKNSPTEFGEMRVADDLLTRGPAKTSKVVGRAQGTYTSTSQSDSGYLMTINFFFTEGEYNGSTLTMLGRNAILSNVREMPIVGGSGVFRWARGFALAHTYVFNRTSMNAIVEYNVYVLHY